MSVRAVEFYSGVGGLHLALSRSNTSGTVVRAYDWDKAACIVYESRFQPRIAEKVNISKLTAAQLATYKADLWLLSPSCQPYTVLNPEAKGAADPRAKSFLHLIEDILPALSSTNAQPKYVLIENVAGFETSTTRQMLLKVLDGLEYSVVELLLTPLQFGIPNSRLRYYLLARTGAKPFAHVTLPSDAQRIWRHIPGHGEDWKDPRLHPDEEGEPAHDTPDCLSAYLNELSEGEFQRFRIPDRILERWGRNFDIVLPSSRRSCCFTRGYFHMVGRSGSILQLNEVLDTSQTFELFFEAQAKGQPDAVRILDPLNLRYFTPTELLRLFQFEPKGAEFAWPDVISLKSQYKLIGNSVNVRVVTELINYLFEE